VRKDVFVSPQSSSTREQWNIYFSQNNNVGVVSVIKL